MKNMKETYKMKYKQTLMENMQAFAYENQKFNKEKSKNQNKRSMEEYPIVERLQKTYIFVEVKKVDVRIHLPTFMEQIHLQKAQKCVLLQNIYN